MKTKIVLITGGTGLLGTLLSELLAEKGYLVRHLSRRPDSTARFPRFAWDIPAGTIDQEAFNGVSAIIHLAGAGIADKRWTTARKKELIQSRVASTALLSQAIARMESKPDVVVACSAIGYYGSSQTATFTENSQPATEGFMEEVCAAWEQASDAIRQQGIRTPLIRVGIVLSRKGGALPELMKTYPVGVGSYFGKGQQQYSWIHIKDICRLFIEAMENSSYKMIYNGVAPNPCTLKKLANGMARAWPSPVVVLPAPEFALKVLLGEMAAIVLNSTRVLPEATMSNGFTFEFPSLKEAMEDLMHKNARY